MDVDFVDFCVLFVVLIGVCIVVDGDEVWIVVFIDLVYEMVEGCVMLEECYVV